MNLSRARFYATLYQLTPHMSAYLFTSLSTVAQVRTTMRSFRETRDLQSWDSSLSLIVIAEDSLQAQALFEDCIHEQAPGEEPMQIEIKKICRAQFLDQLLTENGSESLDWQRVREKVTAQAQSTPADSVEPGYWVDVNQGVLAGKLSLSIDGLRRDLPQDLGADLNWSAEKQFLCILSIFSAPPPVHTQKPEDGNSSPLAEVQDEIAQDSNTIELRELYEIYPQARDKDAAALIQARNSIVAAWLWRRYSAATHLAVNPIRIDPMCGMLGLPETNKTPG